MTREKDQLFEEMDPIQRVGATIALRTKGDNTIWGIVLLLSLISVLVVYSAGSTLAYKTASGSTERLLISQLFFIVVGLVFMYTMHLVNYTFYARIAKLAFYVSIPLLIYTLFFGARINDGSRWIMLPIVNLTIQTSDVAKLSLFMYLSFQLSRRQNYISDFKRGFLPLIIPIGIICGLIMPANLSNALLTAATSMIILFIGRVPFKFLLYAIVPVLLVGAIIGGMAINKHYNGNGVIAQGVQSLGRVGTWVNRVEDFVWASDKEVPYQVQQAKIAISNGSVVYGLGPGNSHQRSYLPQAYNDFIYSIIIEEYGLIGGLVIMGLYLVFLFRCIRIFKRCPYAFGAFLALSLSFTLVIQAVANMAVNVDLVPVTGVTMPLISKGGSSFVFTCCSIGIILSVARNVEQMEGRAPLEENEHMVVADPNPAPSV